jgi:lycopene cyclase-like protein
VLIAPEPKSLWKPNYCLWADELPSDMSAFVERTWPHISVSTPHGSKRFARSYVKLDGRALQSSLWEKVHAGVSEVVQGNAVHFDHRPDETRVSTSSGVVPRARVIIDASGANSRFVRRVHQRPPAFQTAYGVELYAPTHQFDRDAVVLMDFRPAPGAPTELPSFLYVLPLDEDRLFIEETSLARRPGVSLDHLRQRLDARLAELGLLRCERLGEERCAIAMGLGLPVRRQHVLPFGAAGGMVHPASGYLMAHVFRKVSPVADATLQGLHAGGRRGALESGHAALWPGSQRALWELYGFGLETLVRMDTDEIGGFFNSFFELPVEAWAGFLSGTVEPTELGVIMTRLFRSLPGLLRWHLVRTGLFAGAAPLARSILQPGMPR